MTRDLRLRALQRQILRLESRLKQMRVRSDRFSRYRLLAFFCTLLLTATTNFTVGETIAWVVFSLGMLTFIVLAFLHRLLNRSMRRAEIWLSLKQQQEARMRLDWERIPACEYKIDPEHPFQFDLDILGERSLHRLMDIAVTREGSSQLTQWLISPVSSPSSILKRQKTVRELIPRTHFRNKLYLHFSLVSQSQLEGRQLIRWLERAVTIRRRRWLLPLLSGMAAVNLLLFGFSASGLLPAYYFWTLLAYAAVFLANHKAIGLLMRETSLLELELAKFRAILRFLETYRYPQESVLAEICRPFWEPETRPSVHFRWMKIISLLIGLRGNPLLNLALNALMPWDYYCAWLLRRQCSRLVDRLPAWLETFFVLEGFLSLANFGYLNPEYTFPVIHAEANDSTPLLAARGLGHPLIPHEQRVCNDFSVRSPGTISLITGSNMAGKSTFLKTVGVNLCLAYAGAPVAAHSLSTLPMRLFTCVKINDSVTDGFSYFYAEVRRLKALLEALEETGAPLLFYLIDEIFKGTNNRERLIGSRAYIRKLAGCRGAGLISTHDLELVHLEGEIPGLENYHFREEVVGGKMTFDYKLRSGPCPTTNALKIMQMQGLPVNGDGSDARANSQAGPAAVSAAP